MPKQPCIYTNISRFLFRHQFVCVESLVTAMVDMYPSTFRRKNRRELFILAVAVVSFLLGLIMLTEVGPHLQITEHACNLAQRRVVISYMQNHFYSKPYWTIMVTMPNTETVSYNNCGLVANGGILKA